MDLWLCAQDHAAGAPPVACTLVDARIRRAIDGDPATTVFVELLGGTFQMGSDVRADEQARHTVTVDGFAAALTPVSNAHFAVFLRETGHEPPGFWDDPHFSAPDRPVVGVNWFDAVDYCAWLSRLVDRRCRLPSEGEREYAAGGGAVDGRAYPWGDQPWLAGEFARGSQGAHRPHLLGSTEPNGFGLYHMAESVHEWCSDWYAKGYPRGAATNPTGPAAGERRASRGGSWRHSVKVSRIAARSSLGPERRYNDYGMRVYADRR